MKGADEHDVRVESHLDVDGALATAFRLVHDDPDKTIALADDVLTTSAPGAANRASALWARAVGRREAGDLPGGSADLRDARQLALEHGDVGLAARIDVTRALLALHTESAPRALEILASAEPHLHGADLARLEMQRGLVHHRSGHLTTAEASYLAARRRFVGTDDVMGRIRLSLNLGILRSQRGSFDAAKIILAEAVDLATANGQRFLTAAALHNRGYALSNVGSFPAALHDLEMAEDIYQALGRIDLVAVTAADRAEVLLRSNLLDDAVVAADAAMDDIRRVGNETELADAALLAARCRLAAGMTDQARAAALESAGLLQRQARTAWAALAELVVAEVDAGERPDPSTAGALLSVAERLHEQGWAAEANAARVLAGQTFLRCGRLKDAAAALHHVHTSRVRPAGERATAQLARALVAEARGDRAGARRAVRLGLHVVEQNQASLGALESRTMAAGHGAELVEVGIRLAIADQRPREVLARLEAPRRMLWLVPRAAPPDDAVLTRLLGELRLLADSARAAVLEGGATPSPQRQRRQLELERAVRDRIRQTFGAGVEATVDVGEAITEGHDCAILEYAVSDGVLHAVSVIRGRARLHRIGGLADVADAVDGCTFALHRLNRSHGSAAARASAVQLLHSMAADLDALLVPAAIRRVDDPLVVVPVGALHGLAWATLPTLAGRPISVAPSLIGWAVARRKSARSRSDPVVVVAGPGLVGARAEAGRIAAVHPGSVVLTGAAATVGRVVGHFGRSRLAHVACHGAFRQDNPLFSALRLADGNLIVHDLERGTATTPETVVLSACDAAVSAAQRGGTLLGLANALIQLGSTCVVAPVVPVNDEHVVDVMVRLHQGLAAGVSAPRALATVIAADGALDPAAAAFVAIGA